MRRVYQRLWLLLAAISIAGCESDVASTAERPPARVASLAAATYFRSGESAPVGWSESPLRLLAERTEGDRSATFEISPLAANSPSRVLSRTDEDCRIAAAFRSGGRCLLDCAPFPSGRQSDLLIVEADGRRHRLAATGGTSLRYLAADATGETVWLAAQPAAGAAEVVVAEAPAWRLRTVLAAPPGYQIVAFAPQTRSAVLRRELTPEADEVLLFDGESGDRHLLLPSAGDGRFRQIAWIDEGRELQLLADDGGDASRLERFDPASGARQPFGPPLPCPPVRLEIWPAGETTVTMSCDGRTTAVLLDAEGRPRTLPPLAAGLRALDIVPRAGAVELALATAGERWPREIGWLDAREDFRPLSYSLDPRLAPDRLPVGAPFRLASGGTELPAELWSPTARAPRAVAVWFEDDDQPAAFGEHWPFGAALAAHGVAVLRLRGRGAESPSRRFRLAADGAPEEAALADIAAAAAAARRLTSDVRSPLFLVAEGAWRGAAALAYGTRDDGGFDALVALGPAADPLAAALEPATPDAPLGEYLLARWGSDAVRRLDARVLANWRFPVDRVRRPATVVLDAADPASAGLAATVDAARLAGVAVTARRVVLARTGRHRFAPVEPEIAAAILDSLGAPPR